MELWIIGPDWEGLRARLEKKAADLDMAGSVHFLGEVTEAKKAAELACAGFFVSASRYEGFGLSLVEAMAAGCIPIVQHLPSFNHITKQAHTGALIDFVDFASAGKLISGWNAKTASFLSGQSESAHQLAQRFGWKNHVDLTLEAYALALETVRKHPL
jgi:alpha-1,3-mannosyltransferase